MIVSYVMFLVQVMDVLSRKPDIKLHMVPEDMDTLIPLQYSILK